MNGENDNLPKREAEYFIMRQSQLPARAIGGQAHPQSLQINCNIFSTDSPEEALARIKRMEGLFAKVQALHEVRFIEQTLENHRNVMKSEMDIFDELREENKTQGRAMKQNRRDMFMKLPSQMELRKQQLLLLEQQLKDKQEEAEGLL